MTPEIIKAFTDIAGPWAVVGILLLFVFLWLKRDDKSVRATLESQIKSFEAIGQALTRMESCLQNHDIRAVEVAHVSELVLDKVREIAQQLDRLRDLAPLLEKKIREAI